MNERETKMKTATGKAREYAAGRNPMLVHRTAEDRYAAVFAEARAFLYGFDYAIELLQNEEKNESKGKRYPGDFVDWLIGKRR